MLYKISVSANFFGFERHEAEVSVSCQVNAQRKADGARDGWHYHYADGMIERSWDYRISVTAGPIEFLLRSIDSELSILYKKKCLHFCSTWSRRRYRDAKFKVSKFYLRYSFFFRQIIGILLGLLTTERASCALQ